jgi:plastocyanin
LRKRTKGSKVVVGTFTNVTDGATTPVVAGLAVGIAFVALLSIYFAGESAKYNEKAASDQIAIILLPSGLACAGCQENFEPQTIKVVIGANNTVRWVNNDLFPGMIEADNDNDPLFYTITKDFVIIESGKSFEFTFTKAGEYGYHGKPWQRGTVVVVMPNGEDEAGDSNTIDCKKYASPALEPQECLNARVPDLTLSVAGQKYTGDKGSFCAPDICADTMFIIPEALVRIEKGSEIAFEAVGSRQPDMLDVTIYVGENTPAPDNMQLSKRNETRRFTVDLPAGDYIFFVSANWMKSEYSEMGATYYYKVRVS